MGLIQQKYAADCQKNTNNVAAPWSFPPCFQGLVGIFTQLDQ